jgi:hypothetical protein
MNGFGSKLTLPSMNPGAYSSENISTNNPYDDPNLYETQDSVEQFKIFTPEELKNAITMGKAFHLRPMSDAEYNSNINALKTQRNYQGRQLLKYELAALARVVKENFEKFYPKVALDYEVDNSLEFHFELDSIFTDTYNDVVEQLRGVYATSTAEESLNSYTLPEKKRLRATGTAFVGPTFKMLDEMEAAQTLLKSVEGKTVYQHPLLKYNMLKGK